jgi:NADPH:quinone reductase-like Zn-dependent oxidoreductase
MIGKKVSISAPKEKNDGTYSTHMLVPSNSAIIWPDIYDLKQISCSNVNPLTVIGFKNLIK